MVCHCVWSMLALIHLVSSEHFDRQTQLDIDRPISAESSQLTFGLDKDGLKELPSCENLRIFNARSLKPG